MRVCLLAWDPDGRNGGRAALSDLLPALERGGVDTVAVTDRATAAAIGTRVVGVPEAPPVLIDRGPTTRQTVLSIGSVLHAGAVSALGVHTTDVVHTIGWHTAYAATNLRASHDVAIVAHLLDRGGAPRAEDGFAHQVRWWLTYESRHVLTPTAEKRRRLLAAYALPEEKVTSMRTPRLDRRGRPTATLARLKERYNEAVAQEAALSGREPVEAVRPKLLRVVG